MPAGVVPYRGAVAVEDAAVPQPDFIATGFMGMGIQVFDFGLEFPGIFQEVLYCLQGGFAGSGAYHLFRDVPHFDEAPVVG